MPIAVAGILTGIDLIMQLIDKMSAIGAKIAAARKEGRDLTEAELDELASQYDNAAAELRATIAKAKAGK